MGYKKLLENIIPKKILERVNRTYELIGDIAIIEIDDKEVLKYEIQIAKAIMNFSKNVKGVFRKEGNYKGEFRTRNFKYIFGDRKTQTKYIENGVKLLVDIKDVYFSAKLSHEREILFSKELNEKSILVLFSGVGPYSFCAYKNNSDVKKIVSIEINKKAHKIALENLKLNSSISKKNKVYSLLKNFLKENQIYLKEKYLCEKITKLFLIFFNDDVNKKLADLCINNYMIDFDNIGEIEFENNVFLTRNNREILNYFLSKKEKTIFLDFDNFNINLFKEILILLLLEKKLFIKFQNNFYNFKDEFSKNLLLQFLLERKSFTDKVIFDEIYMPLPKNAYKFLDNLLNTIAKKTKIHLYDFATSKEESIKKVDDFLERNSLKGKVLEAVKTTQISPKKYRMRITFEIL